MLDYLYDGSFEGLLTCVYHHYYSEKASGIFFQGSYQSTMLRSYKVIETEEEKAMRVYSAVAEKISPAALGRIYNVFLSSSEDKETKILAYLVMGFKMGSGISLLHSHPVVLALQQIEKKVLFEVHRLSGLVRFSVLSGNKLGYAGQEQQEILYCPLEPDHDVIELLADHFADRLKSEPFVLHDKRRGKAVFAFGGNWYISAYTQDPMSQLTGAEKHWQSLWQEYFDTIAIKERTNPRCQKNFMPVRYWKNLTEFQGGRWEI